VSLNYNKVTFLCSYGTASQIKPSEKREIVFAGRSNVGKSTLLNKLFNRKSLARVSSVPGKTATINFFGLEDSHTDLHFVDLPGYGYAKVAKTEKARWGGLIEKYFSMERDIALVFLLVDIRHTPSKDDIGMIEFLRQVGLEYVIVLTKADKLNKTERKNRLEALEAEIPHYEETEIIEFSSKTFEGVEKIHEILEKIANCK
jgi:GTP-binding protein